MTAPTREQLEDGYICTWSKAHPPLRPSEAELAFYRKWFGLALPGRHGRLLILGSTAELRDMALQRGLRPTCGDMSRRIWEAMRALMNHRGPEDFICGNWLDIPEDQTWDLILGDGSLVMMPPESLDAFLCKLRRLAGDRGTVVLRYGGRTRPVPLEFFGEAARRFATEGGNRTLYEYLAYLINLLRSQHAPDMETHPFVEERLMRFLNPDQQETLRNQLWDWRVWLPEKRDLDERFAKYFRTQETHVSTEPGNWDISFVTAFRA